LKQVPGFYAEASGGNVNNNLFSRGMPADGSYRYVIMMEDGIPANDANDLFFLGADNFVRVDRNIDRIEAVRGGNSALFGSNAPGGVVNFINKTGGPALSSIVLLQTGTDGLFRFDGNVNGPVSADWRFNVGGYWNFDQGIRDPGFRSVTGGQLKASLTRLFEGGYVTVTGKYLNESNVFYLPLPLQPGTVTGTKMVGDEEVDVIELQSEFVSGFPSNGTMTSREGTNKVIPLPQGNGEFALPLENGIGGTGASLNLDFGMTLAGRWEFRNVARVMNLEHEWNAMLPFTVQDKDEYIQGLLDSTGGTNSELVYTESADDFDTSNDLVSLGGQWHVEKPVTNFSDQLTLNKRFDLEGWSHQLVVGGYFGYYTANNNWMFNDILTEVATQPRFLDVTITDDAANILFASQNGFTRYLSNYVNGFGSAVLYAGFIGDEITVNNWRFDLGFRLEHDDYEQNIENNSSFDNGDAGTTADNDMVWGDRTFTRVDTTYTEWAATLGGTYNLTDATSVYLRGTRGYKMPLLDQFLFSTAVDSIPSEEIYQAEGGVKISSDQWGVSAVLYALWVQNFPSQDVVVRDGQTTFESAFVGESRTLGIEFEGIWMPIQGARLFGQATLQNPEYTNFVEGDVVLSGNRVRRVPSIITLLGGSYVYRGIGLQADWRYTGDRWSNTANTINLPAFSNVGARLWWDIPASGVQAYIAGQNLLDGAGLTEGNPRLDETTGSQAGPALARPILPRRFIFGFQYKM
jgi:outer membrane receptor protein involved in Fe transport